ncbi:MAG: TonB-dependent receptor domain-containing protein [Rhodothermales bacterium]
MLETLLKKKLLPGVLLLFCWSGWSMAWAQSPEAGPQYTLAVRGVALGEALERFARVTGLALAYDPVLVRGQYAFCVAQNEPAEDVLRCLLKESDLDFYRLSSGTYVLALRPELPPQPGYLAGLVTDQATGTPLSGAHVYLAEADFGSVTNGTGQFVLPPLLPGRYAVRITHLGYHVWEDTLRVTSHEQTRAEAALQAQTVFITPVVVDGVTERLAADLLGQALVEQSGALATAAVGPTYRELGALAGVRLSDVTADAHVQGGEAGEHELRLDGVPVYLPRTSTGLIGPFSAFALERITVHKAGFDAAQGSQTSGILLAEHGLGRTNRAEVQVDPLSLNVRVQLAPSPEKLTVMAARLGLWDVYAPPRLHTTLAAWGAPDLFLITAPLSAETDVSTLDAATPSDLDAGPYPALHFSDLHAAARLRLSPLRTVYASAYQGRNQLTGGLFADDANLFSYGAAERALFTVFDDYRWQNRLAQVRYDAVLGSRTLASVQAWASQYTLRHSYDVLDSVIVRVEDNVARLLPGETTPIRDGNDVRTLALKGSVDHARPRHRLRFGAEVLQTESLFALHDVRFPAAGYSPEAVQVGGDRAYSQYSPLRQPVSHVAGRWRLAAFADDAWTLTPRLRAELGLRLTYLPDRSETYAEPRAALYYNREQGPLGPWSLRTAAGLYRQFQNQVDVSVLNAGALLPSVRVWLPLDASVRPPMTYHLAQAARFQPAEQWHLSLEGYYKHQPHRLAIAYAPAGTHPYAGRARAQADFPTSAQRRAYGGAVSLEWSPDWARLEATYEYDHAEQQSPDLFEGRSEPVPWNEPHRAELGVDWMPTPHLTLSARGRGVWGRAWGFRQAYYDYFGHSAETRFHGPYDFGRPSDHVLPPLYALDLSVAYARPLGRADVQLRLDLLNATDRRNVADWRLAFEDGTWRKQPRYLYPRMPLLALRVGF